MLSPPTKRDPSFKTPLRHRRFGYVLRLALDRPRPMRDKPALASFPAIVAGDTRPPVRIFIGTETGQARGERVLVWSILKHRDPKRAYHVYLMRELAGFDRRFWKTGFSNYRYAIPAMAGGAGRAIYNDVDQIYLADPAELFDLPLGDGGAAMLNDGDTSVMTIDCARMAPIWPAALARSGRRKHRAFLALIDAAGLRTPLPPEWNARDKEYRAGQSKLLHFTTLQSQPWRPFPNEISYIPHAHGALWEGLEAEADAQGFTIFTNTNPSPEFAVAAARPAQPLPADRFLRNAERLGVRSVLALGGGDLAGAATATPLALADALAGAPHAADAAIALGTLDAMPEDDIPWLLDSLFKAATRLVYVEVRHGVRDARWWRQRLTAAGKRTPGVPWTLHCQAPWRLFPGRTFAGKCKGSAPCDA